MCPSPHGITRSEFAYTFVPFGLLLCAALLVPEQEQNLTLGRVRFTIWLSTLLLIPALCLYALPQRGPRHGRYALLLSTWSYLAYMVHFAYATFGVFGGIPGIFENMRLPIAVTNLALTAWWTVDILVAWLAAPERPWVRWERGAFHVFVFLIFTITELFLRPTAVRYLGLVLALAVPYCLLVRLHERRRTGEAAPASVATDSL